MDPSNPTNVHNKKKNMKCFTGDELERLRWSTRKELYQLVHFVLTGFARIHNQHDRCRGKHIII